MGGNRRLPLLASLGFLLSVSQAIQETSFGQYPDRCPAKCSRLGPDPSKWPHIHRLSDFEGCHDQPLLFDLNVQNLVDDPRTQITIRTCSRDSGKGEYDDDTSLRARDPAAAVDVDGNCGATAKEVEVLAQLGSSATTRSASTVDPSAASLAIDQLIDYLNDEATCGTTIMFSKSGDAVVGLYSGAQVQKASAASLIRMFQDHARNGSDSRTLQICDTERSGSAAHTLGLFVAGAADLAVAQKAVKSWANGECIEGVSDNNEKARMNLLVSSIEESNDTANSNSSDRKSLQKRALCRDIQVDSGDSCGALATRCGISGEDLMKFNPIPNFCSTLMPKQWVCCTEGDLPDHSPQPGEDGSCFTYKVEPDDGCWAIGDSFGIDQSEIEEHNKDTWGWAGCDYLQAGQVICLSEGDPPFPPPIEGVACGPQVPGTSKPTDGTPYAELNPCPLNSCCDVWGFCGITEEFCTPTPADTGAPGTAQPGTNGCISNCGTDVVNNDDPPASFIQVGYFEAWNNERSCLTMDVDQIDTSSITHIHFAFATVTEDWKVSVADVQDQFNKFTKLSGVKKIVSFGGWAFSTEPETFQRFRDATKPENVATFANNCLAFLNEHNLDGLDFDWEYPGAPDIPGIPPGSEEEAHNYNEFLKAMKRRMPKGSSLSIALPASYWYLKPYPVEAMAKVLDYFVFMSYDLHGQWDVGSEWSSPGCPGGNCLRSHVNKTETAYALAMVTKAGLPANKVLVGITSYGRGFRMTDSDCRGPLCTFTGTKNSSDAYPGRCTETAGYISNAEIDEIIANSGDFSLVDSYRDDDSDSDILVYGTPGKADWVAYMTQKTKDSRVNWVKGLNFGGSTDWAVDLMEFVDDDDDGNNVCKPEDRTYSTEKVRQGEYMPWYLMEPEYAATTGRQYITIVNLTPHRFVVLESTHSYQMDEFNWADIPPGRARQNVAHYTGRVGANPVDTNGEAYYRIEGTDKKFEVRATTHIPDHHPRRTIFDLTGMGLGQREYKDPEQESPVTLVITGSDKYGFMANLAHGPGGWMSAMYDVIKDRQIKHIVMPGTHDSGMSKITNKITPLGNSANTQTQGINIYDQLRAGARWFDLRIASVHNIPDNGGYEFWVLHVNDETAEVAAGNSGESLEEVIREINKFTSENPGEVIFFRIRYLVGIREIPSLGPIYWGDDIVKDFFSKLKGVNNRCPNLDTGTKFQDREASYFMDRNERKGCVIFLLAGHLQDGVPQDSIGDGIYRAGQLEIWDNWSNKGDTEEMAVDQMADWKTVHRSGDFKNDQFLVGQWLVTTDIFTSGTIGLQSLAILPTNPALYWAGINDMSPEHWPNVLMVDYIGVVVKDENDWDQLSADIYTLAIGLNLYMISENCDISPKKSPLLKDKKAKSRLASAPWNGIVFANGTVLNNPPPTLHYGRVEYLKNGTVFSNGTVLQETVPNPNFNTKLSLEF